MPPVPSRMANAEIAWDPASFWDATDSPFSIGNDRLSSRISITKPPSAWLLRYPPRMVCWMAELQDVSFCEPMIAPSCLRFNHAVSWENCRRLKSNPSSGVLMEARSPFYASMALSLPTANWNSCAPFPTMFVSRVGAGMSAPPEEPPRNSSSTPLSTTSNTVCLREIRVPFVRWTSPSMRCVLSRISCLDWTVNLARASFKLMPPKLVSSWPWPRSVTERSCTW